MRQKHCCRLFSRIGTGGGDYREEGGVVVKGYKAAFTQRSSIATELT